ncbi:hypothetical protein NDU88_000729 [Pleurodeles waltl]|uniref:Uncharacterized protein n=1 Tax=Pleurodeles waltl TaxID=8319 RepID=A0AAV7U4D1_PLEWA|nr:hypothetical protein NDU88_000729 [Pleurodeles waltl]
MLGDCHAGKETLHQESVSGVLPQPQRVASEVPASRGSSRAVQLPEKPATICPCWTSMEPQGQNTGAGGVSYVVPKECAGTAACLRTAVVCFQIDGEYESSAFAPRCTHERSHLLGLMDVPQEARKGFKFVTLWNSFQISTRDRPGLP